MRGWALDPLDWNVCQMRRLVFDRRFRRGSKGQLTDISHFEPDLDIFRRRKAGFFKEFGVH